MSKMANPTNEIKKLQVEEIVLFTIRNIPQADPTTLERFLELVNAGGTFGTISHEQILRKMTLVLKYIPNACTHSLLILMDLLEIKPAQQLALEAPQTDWLRSNIGQAEPMPFLVDVRSVSQPVG